MFYFSLTAKPCFPELFIRCFKTERNSHSHTQRVYSNTQKKRDKETPKREERRLEERGRPEKVCVDWRW